MPNSSSSHHHHQNNPKPDSFLNPEAELISLARSKGQVLTANTLRIIRECIELRGVTLHEFVEAVRPHFKNAINNPSGFLINFARKSHLESQPAVAPAAPIRIRVTNSCEECHDDGLVLLRRSDQALPKVCDVRVDSGLGIKGGRSTTARRNPSSRPKLDLSRVCHRQSGTSV